MVRPRLELEQRLADADVESARAEAIAAHAAWLAAVRRYDTARLELEDALRRRARVPYR